MKSKPSSRRFKGPLASYNRLEELVPPALAPVPPRFAGLSAAGIGKSLWRLVLEDEIRKYGSEGLLSGKKVRDQGQHMRGRRSNDERLGAARRPMCPSSTPPW